MNLPDQSETLQMPADDRYLLGALVRITKCAANYPAKIRWGIQCVRINQGDLSDTHARKLLSQRRAAPCIDSRAYHGREPACGGTQLISPLRLPAVRRGE